ncbi:hypothetical protein E4T44_06446 [Aureobasidium sp. EXF-8845]|nr:hypothetical protein E4T44_06446 [Aureobasidium sp. EXF-8845]KAI4846365.1 hypothetical protein E4T45_07281 [Aureobasidium sp. EXF-8846]
MSRFLLYHADHTLNHSYKTYLFFLLGVNGGISNFGTIIIKGFGFSTLVTTLMQVPYGKHQ